MNNKIDWTIHAVCDPVLLDKPVDMHTHGLEEHGILNICMECPSRDYKMISFCGNFINKLAKSMINGEAYRTGTTHMCDNNDNWNEVLDVFDLDIDKRDNGEGEESVYVVDYWFDDIFLNHNNLFHYVFDRNTMRWRILTREEYDAMPKEEYEKRMARNKF